MVATLYDDGFEMVFHHGIKYVNYRHSSQTISAASPNEGPTGQRAGALERVFYIYGK